MSEPTIYNEIALKIKGQQKEVEKLRKELKLAEENEEYWHNAFSDLEDEYARLNNIINELEKFIENQVYDNVLQEATSNDILNKLIELKKINGKGDE